MGNKGIIATCLVVLVIIVLGALNPIKMVDVGQRGIKSTWGKVSPESYKEGIHVVVPVAQKMDIMDIRTQKKNMKTQVYTKDIQQATINYVLNYNLRCDKVHEVYRKVGRSFEDKIVIPTTEGVLKNVIGQQNAQDLIANRPKVTDSVKFNLQEQLKDDFIDITDFQIINIDYSNTFETAIEKKVVAKQQALEAQNMTVKVKEEADQAIIKAQAEAKAMRIKANALTQNKNLIEYEKLDVEKEAIKKWNGKYPENLTIMGKEAFPIIQVK